MATTPALPNSRPAIAPLALLSALSILASAAVHGQEVGGSRSVIGTNTYMSDGATALMLGNYAKGVELTQMGLRDVLTAPERATLLSNLCAGYVGLKEFDVALVYCNRSLDIDPDNWRALQNRAAAYSGIGNVTKALVDIEHGLTLNPGSDALKLTLAIVREQASRMPGRQGAASGTTIRTNLSDPGTIPPAPTAAP